MPDEKKMQKRVKTTKLVVDLKRSSREITATEPGNRCELSTPDFELVGFCRRKTQSLISYAAAKNHFFLSPTIKQISLLRLLSSFLVSKTQHVLKLICDNRSWREKEQIRAY